VAWRHNSANGRQALSAFVYLSFFALAITVPLLLLLGALLFQSVSELRDEREHRILQVLDAVTNDLDRDLDRDIAILNTLSTSQAIANADWRTFYDQAKAGLQGRAYLILVDATGRQLVNTYVPYGEQPAMTGDPETVRRIVATKAPAISNLFTSLVVKKPVFNVSIPILAQGQVRYVMSLGLLPENLVALLASQRLGPEWVAMVWDGHGTILARSRENTRYVGTALPQILREHGGRLVVRARNLDGIDVLHATARSRVAGWGIGVNIPYAVIMEQMRRTLLLWGAAAILAIVIALALGLYMARQIANILTAASKAAAAIGHDEPVPLAGSHLKEADAFLATLRDAQDQLHKTQAYQQLLMRESQHRTMNLFAVVQSIVQRSLRDGQTAAQARQIIAGRLNALARTHAIVEGTEWKGAHLEGILRKELGETFAESVDIAGCDMAVNATAGQIFALIFHELTTNAVKYGALSVPGGRISIAGSVTQDGGEPQFCFSWSESGGPKVSQPTRKGFGSVILVEAAKQFGMKVCATYDPAGLQYTLRLAVHAIAIPGTPDEAAASPEAASGQIQSRSMPAQALADTEAGIAART
jgi:two-component sensor histidine kinase